ncbi:hypothetical protein EVI01_08470 [Enterococcus villorum]|uniref:Uncharacterized protein n=1 Tax=Enterococcus villorum TaxID=112904 RepID=A0A511J0G8_9ENTE|nr:hypothetical protein EVI01_08470 [Enterococcus villorum]
MFQLLLKIEANQLATIDRHNSYARITDTGTKGLEKIQSQPKSGSPL